MTTTKAGKNKPPRPSRAPRSSAPAVGIAAAPVARAGAGAISHGCAGCRHLKPARMCACCGEATAVVLPAGEHTLPLCARCYATLLKVCSPARARELRCEVEQVQLRRRRGVPPVVPEAHQVEGEACA